MEQLLHLKLELDVTYRPNGASAEQLSGLLNAAVDHMLGNGMITGSTEAEIEEVICRVTPIPTDIKEA